jgi:hypothetical protein
VGAVSVGTTLKVQSDVRELKGDSEIRTEEAPAGNSVVKTLVPCQDRCRQQRTPRHKKERHQRHGERERPSGLKRALQTRPCVSEQGTPFVVTHFHNMTASRRRQPHPNYTHDQLSRRRRLALCWAWNTNNMAR